DGEGLARCCVNLFLQPRHFLREAAREALEMIAIHLDACALHARNHRDEWPIDQLINARDALLRETRLEARPQAIRHVRILRAIAGGGIERHLREADLLLAGARNLLEADTLMLEQAVRQLIHAVP